MKDDFTASASHEDEGPQQPPESPSGRRARVRSANVVSARYREQQKVTHHPAEAVGVPASVPLAPTEAVLETADRSGASEKTDAKDKRTYRRAWCERERQFLRHETLAKYRPRWRRPP